MDLKVVAEIGDDVDACITDAFERAATRAASEIELVVGDSTRLDRRHLALFESGIRRIPSLRVLEIRSNTISVRLFTSTLALRVPNVRIVVIGSNADTQAASVPFAGPERLVGSDDEGAHDVVDIEPGAEFEQTIRGAFPRLAARGTPVATLRFAKDVPLPRNLRSSLEQLLGTTSLRQLTLVHPSGLLGFVASTLSLRFPKVRISSCSGFENGG